jgi:glucose-1-phosphate cytidylyltransferase
MSIRSPLDYITTVRTIILAGGLGTRISEETADKPKPMVEIGGKPVLWHIIKTYSSYGFEDFTIATGYKSEVIDKYLSSDLSRDPDLKVRAFNTGLNTATGGRIKRCMDSFPGEPTFATYGDGVANIDIKALLAFHRSHGKLATLTAVRPPARFGRIELDGDSVTHFGEKMQSQEGWINGGYFVLEPEVSNFISGDDMPFEHDPLVNLTAAGQLRAYKHEGFWQPMDTLRERNELEALWQSDQAPWKIW